MPVGGGCVQSWDSVPFFLSFFLPRIPSPNHRSNEPSNLPCTITRFPQPRSFPVRTTTLVGLINLDEIEQTLTTGRDMSAVLNGRFSFRRDSRSDGSRSSMKGRRSRVRRLAPVDSRVYGPAILRLLLQDVNARVSWQLEALAPFLSQSLCACKKRGG